MYQKMLVPLDGSKFSECSLEHVKIIALGCNIPEVVLLMVVEPQIMSYGTGEDALPISMMSDVEKSAEAWAKKYISKVAGDLKKEGMAAKTAVVKGKADDEILNYAKKNAVDLIIMSTHGRAGISRWVMGSVADRVVRQSPVPLLLVSPPGCKSS